LLTDETSNVTVQLRGGSAKGNRRYQVTGSMVPNATPASGATQVLNVASAKELGACGTGAAGAAGAAGAGGAAAAGLGTAAIAGIAIGVAAAVAVGATAAAGGFSSSNAANVNVTP
jgi:hypothetical protein